MTLTTPAKAAGPVTVVLELGFDFAAFRAAAERAGRPLQPPLPQQGPTWQQQVLAKGWADAITYPTSVQPDNGQGLPKELSVS